MLIVTSLIGLTLVMRRIRGNRSQTEGRQAASVHDRLIDIGEDSLPVSRSQIGSFGKVDLHCHLNGSVRKSTLSELLGSSVDLDTKHVHTIEDAFTEFKKVYDVVNSQAILRRIVRETLSDAKADNVLYLELRTTPRKLSDVPSTKDYVRIVVDEISNFPHLNRLKPITSFPRGKIAVRLILTVDRAQPLSIAEQTVDIALRFPGIVVGIDFAGDPSVGSFEEFVPVFERARGHGLSTTIHTSEISGAEKDTEVILNFKPNRIGHFLFPTDDQISKAMSYGIGIESCPTSNMCALYGSFPVDGCFENHSIMGKFIRHPSGIISINTDDPGIFDVKLSDELFAVGNSFRLNLKELKCVILNSARQSFLDKGEKDALVESLAMSF